MCFWIVLLTKKLKKKKIFLRYFSRQKIPDNMSRVMLGCFNPTLVQIWTNPVTGINFFITFLTQRLGLSIFDPKLGFKTTLECK